MLATAKIINNLCIQHTRLALNYAFKPYMRRIGVYLYLYRWELHFNPLSTAHNLKKEKRTMAIAIWLYNMYYTT